MLYYYLLLNPIILQPIFIGRQCGPDSPPTISQSMSVGLRLLSLDNNGSAEINFILALQFRSIPALFKIFIALYGNSHPYIIDPQDFIV